MISFSIKELTKEHLEVKLKGDLDIDSTEIVEENLIPVIENCKAVNLNFEHVPFVDSSGMGLLLNLVHSLTERNIKVTISNVREDVFNVFELLQIPEILGEETFI